MEKTIKDLLGKVPSEWKKIKEEDYHEKRVHLSEGFDVVAAYEVDGEIVAINSYPEIEGFIEGYDEQMKEMKKRLKGLDWKGISSVYPLKFNYIKNDKEKVYLSVLETYNVDSKVSVQIFYDNGKVTFGFLTSVRKEDKNNIISTINNNQTVKEIFNIIK